MCRHRSGLWGRHNYVKMQLRAVVAVEIYTVISKLALSQLAHFENIF